MNKHSHSSLATTVARVTILSAALMLSSCTSTGSYVVNTIAKLGTYQKIKDIPYDDNNSLDVYIPEATNNVDRQPVVIFFYGGCWGACQLTDKSDYAFLADALTQKGYIVVIPDYRYYPDVKFPAIIADAADATQWVKDNIARYKGDEQKIFLMGHSAGAHLAIMLSVNPAYLHPDTYTSISGGIGLAGPYDFIPFTEPYLPDLFGAESGAAYSQPINFIQGNEPPLLLMYGVKDSTVAKKNIVNLTKKVKSKNGQVSAVYYRNLDHVTIMTGFSRVLRTQKLVDDVSDFIQLFTRHSPVFD